MRIICIYLTVFSFSALHFSATAELSDTTWARGEPVSTETFTLRRLLPLEKTHFILQNAKKHNRELSWVCTRYWDMKYQPQILAGEAPSCTTFVFTASCVDLSPSKGEIPGLGKDGPVGKSWLKLNLSIHIREGLISIHGKKAASSSSSSSSCGETLHCSAFTFPGKKEQGAAEGGEGMRGEWFPGKTTLRTPNRAPKNSQQGLPSQRPVSPSETRPISAKPPCPMGLSEGWWEGRDESETLTGRVTFAHVWVPRSLCPVMNKCRTIHILIPKFNDSTASLKNRVNSQRSQIRLPHLPPPHWDSWAGIPTASRQHKPLY